MTGQTAPEIPESGAVFTFGKSQFADNVPSRFWLKNDRPVQICCGDEHTALLTGDGKLYMFGCNNWGQLGLGTKTTVNKPTCVKALKPERVVLAACGRNHTIVSTSRGDVYTAGDNSEGQLGLGDCVERTSFQLLGLPNCHGPFRMLAAGGSTSAALTEDGRLFMWGDNSEGQIGLGDESNALSPREITVGRSISWVSCGYYHSAFVTVDGDLFTFGERDGGKLGLPPEQLANHRVPQPVLAITDRVIQVACGGAHTAALTEDDLYTFGRGQYGQLGHGTFVFQSPTPKRVQHFRKGRLSRVECGYNHTAVVTGTGLLYTFGDGRHGKLGQGEENFTNLFKPTLSPRFLKFRVQSLACGGCHMLVLATPRSEEEDFSLEDDDVTENYLEMSCIEFLGSSFVHTPLQRSLSARERRRERNKAGDELWCQERCPEQFGLMFQTLPAVTSESLANSVPVYCQTLPAGRLSRSHKPGRMECERTMDQNSHVEDKNRNNLKNFSDVQNLTAAVVRRSGQSALKGRNSHAEEQASKGKKVGIRPGHALPNEVLQRDSGSGKENILSSGQRGRSAGVKSTGGRPRAGSSVLDQGGGPEPGHKIVQCSPMKRQLLQEEKSSEIERKIKEEKKQPEDVKNAHLSVKSKKVEEKCPPIRVESQPILVQSEQGEVTDSPEKQSAKKTLGSARIGDSPPQNSKPAIRLKTDKHLNGVSKDRIKDSNEMAMGLSSEDLDTHCTGNMGSRSFAFTDVVEFTPDAATDGAAPPLQGVMKEVVFCEPAPFSSLGSRKQLATTINVIPETGRPNGKGVTIGGGSGSDEDGQLSDEEKEVIRREGGKGEERRGREAEDENASRDSEGHGGVGEGTESDLEEDSSDEEEEDESAGQRAGREQEGEDESAGLSTGREQDGEDESAGLSTREEQDGEDESGAQSTGEEQDGEDESGGQSTGEEQDGEDESGGQSTGEEQDGEDESGGQSTGEEQDGEDESGGQSTGEEQDGEDESGGQSTGEEQDGEDESGGQSTGEEQDGEDESGGQSTGEEQDGEDDSGGQSTGEEQDGEDESAGQSTGEEQDGEDESAGQSTGEEQDGEDESAGQSTGEEQDGEDESAGQSTGEEQDGEDESKASEEDGRNRRRSVSETESRIEGSDGEADGEQEMTDEGEESSAAEGRGEGEDESSAEEEEENEEAEDEEEEEENEDDAEEEEDEESEKEGGDEEEEEEEEESEDEEEEDEEDAQGEDEELEEDQEEEEEEEEAEEEEDDEEEEEKEVRGGETTKAKSTAAVIKSARKPSSKSQEGISRKRPDASLTSRKRPDASLTSRKCPDASQDTQEFWDDVLPQYLNLK